ncbi:MAG: alanine--tRNA ligase [Candidatus Nealsonbacteria bacterium]|nr:alanine--tRNA ligase [Candidatus Nealsonbacteria bacterium]
MTSNELRQRFLDFFEKKGHKIVPSSSLVPQDSSVLFTSAGMQQFKPYFLGERSPYGKKVASSQKCFRTSDIDEVGDERHLTFFEMLGNFSFGDYFKQEAINYAYDFLKEIGLPIQYVSVFKGDKQVPKDEESVKIWKKLGVKKIKGAGREDNFWGPTGKEGPCGPTTEIYINDTEIWNIVFNEYYQDDKGKLTKLKQKGVDTGMGLERLAMVSQNKKNIFETDLFSKITKEISGQDRAKRIIADHVKGAVFLIADGILPSNIERGYILRRIVRRAIRFGKLLGLASGFLIPLAQKVVDIYKDVYPELLSKQPDILTVIQQEDEKFGKTLEKGLKEFEKLAIKIENGGTAGIGGNDTFMLYETYGFPFELTKELAKERGMKVNEKAHKEFEERHKEISRAGFEGKFGGHGLLLDTGELKAANQEELKKVTRLHTATHLLQAALRKVLGEEVHQAGSDITVERTRFDFSFGRKLTSEELKKTEDLVNGVISKDFKVEYKETPYEEAIRSGALYSKREKYPSVVRVYSVFDENTKEVFSKELCGGPHVQRASEIGRFKIIKEESSGAGIRRIRAVVE